MCAGILIGPIKPRNSGGNDQYKPEKWLTEPSESKESARMMGDLALKWWWAVLDSNQ